MDHEKSFASDIGYLEGNLPIPFDIYIYVNAKLIKIVQADQIPYPSLWAKIKEKKINHVYVKESDELRYIDFGLKKLNANKSKENDVESSISDLICATNSILKHLERNGVNSENINLLKAASAEMIDVVKVTTSPAMFLKKLNETNDLFTHSIYRTVLALHAATELGWKTSFSQSKITTASLLADLSLGLDFPVVLKDKIRLTPEENTIFSDHMKKSLDMVSSEVSLSQEVSLAILHHHENSDGSGPLGITRSNIYPLGHLIRISDEITRITMPSDFNKSPLPFSIALECLGNTKIALPQIISGFSKITSE